VQIKLSALTQSNHAQLLSRTCSGEPNPQHRKNSTLNTQTKTTTTKLGKNKTIKTQILHFKTYFSNKFSFIVLSFRTKIWKVSQTTTFLAK
jgi:hypothetical protein